ncbi:MAG: peptidylprolyl isomerase [Sedimentibacter sp.]|uniref:peptidylprolyl isomerase n=1 Tax=Sedimentibacter sp. TaxID=1960295 RepID=UPI0029814C44|nr:peptidylprolyl isomerase [Sedimentibacter sp.]MDW5298939.1 peptidylprolyl isomerase [Sedimentibacter sp.]
MNKFKKSIGLALTLCIALAVTACSSNSGQTTPDISEEGVIAIVDDKAITQTQYDESLAVYKKMVESQYGEGAWDTEISEGKTMGNFYEDALLDNIILEIIMVEAAEKDGITLSDEDTDKELEDFKVNFTNDDEYTQFLEKNGMTEEYLKEALRKESIINQYLAVKIENLQPTDDELETIFNDLKMNQKVRARHILVATEEEAKAAIERLNNGEKFEDLAKELSIDTGSGANGGDLDYFAYTDMVQPFSEKAFAIEIGEISEPVQSEYGYHIIEVTDKTVDDTITVETEKASLTEYYKSYKYEDLLADLKENANIVKK